MIKNQSRVQELLKRFRAKIQQPAEVEKKYEANKEDMFWLHKDIVKFGGLFDSYVDKYQKMVQTKDEKVNKLLDEHYELYKP